MTSSSHNTSLLVYPILLLILVSTLVTSHECPQHCECSESFDHAKCTSLDGFKNIDKILPIRSLDLSNIKITRLTSQLEKLKNLTELNLSSNRLSEVNRLSKRIKTLDLSNNRITSGKLRKIPQSVQKLNLSHNDITYLPLELMKLTQLRVVELAGNPINCTCDTLHVRNWLTQKHVWSDKHIKCMAPQEYKGRPWLQVKQVDVCTTHRQVTAQTSYNWDDDENDLMLADQPDLGSGHQLPIEDDKDIEEFIPVEARKVKEEPVAAAAHAVDILHTDGSGQESVENHSEEPVVDHSARGVLDGIMEGSGETISSTESTPEDDDEEGSGGGIFLPRNIRKFGSTSESPSSESSSSESPSSESPLSGINDADDDDDNEDDDNPIPDPSLGIWPGDKSSTTASAIDEVEVVTKKHDVVDSGKLPDENGETNPNAAVRVPNDEVSNAKTTEKEVVTATAEDNKSTYILLAVLGIILLSLIMFVACKRKGGNNRNRTEKSDVEKARSTELQDMDKGNLGKAKKNGIPEFVPLIDREKKDLNKPSNGTETYDKPRKLDEVDGVNESKPLLSSFKPIVEHDEPAPHQPNNNDSNNNSNGGLPNGSTTPTPAARNGLPGVHQTPNSLHIPDNNDDDVFMPASEMQPTPKRYSPVYSPRTPKSDRYSPVYSPETGRVKIKLTETPKPKTPLLVTRSRSRAGDYVTTPESDQL